MLSAGREKTNPKTPNANADIQPRATRGERGQLSAAAARAAGAERHGDVRGAGTLTRTATHTGAGIPAEPAGRAPAVRVCVSVRGRGGESGGERLRGADGWLWPGELRQPVCALAPCAFPPCFPFFFFFFKISLGILSFTAFSFFFSHFFFFFPFLSSRCCRGYVLLAKFVVPPLRFPHSPHFGSVQCPFVCRHTAGFFCLFFKKIGILWEANGYRGGRC